MPSIVTDDNMSAKTGSSNNTQVDARSRADAFIDLDGYQIPRKARKRKKDDCATSNVSSIVTGNRFDALTENNTIIINDQSEILNKNPDNQLPETSPKNSKLKPKLTPINVILDGASYTFSQLK